MGYNGELLSIIVPMYNEEKVVEETYKRLKSIFSGFHMSVEMIFINDGSRDETAAKLRAIAKADSMVRVINFSRNFGHQIAISAGMDYAKGDCVAIIDGDLQDPPELIPEMVSKWREGYEVVYGKRIKREGETAFKKLTAKMFYRFLNKMTDVKIPVDVGDFRLIDRKVCECMRRLPERSRYVRGLISWLGFKQTFVEYIRASRFAGETKYPIRKMLRLASDGIISFSTKPLKFAARLGVLFSTLGGVYLIIALVRALLTHSEAQGLFISMAVTLFLFGIVLVFLGIIGEYVGRIYEEVKGRPLYIISECWGLTDEDK